MGPITVVSGGQTGVDRAALDAAVHLGWNIGGWCPKGRKAQDGVINECYPLKETPLGEYRQRTEWNVRDSDGTLILTWGPPTGGTLLTTVLCKQYGKPMFWVDMTQKAGQEAVLAWLKEAHIGVLNVAGPRQRLGSRVYQEAFSFLVAVFSKAKAF